MDRKIPPKYRREFIRYAARSFRDLVADYGTRNRHVTEAQGRLPVSAVCGDCQTRVVKLRDHCANSKVRHDSDPHLRQGLFLPVSEGAEAVADGCKFLRKVLQKSTSAPMKEKKKWPADSVEIWKELYASEQPDGVSKDNEYEWFLAEGEALKASAAAKRRSTPTSRTGGAKATGSVPKTPTTSRPSATPKPKQPSGSAKGKPPKSGGTKPPDSPTKYAPPKKGQKVTEPLKRPGPSDGGGSPKKRKDEPDGVKKSKGSVASEGGGKKAAGGGAGGAGAPDKKKKPK